MCVASLPYDAGHMHCCSLGFSIYAACVLASYADFLMQRVHE